MKEVNTNSGKTYAVTSPNGCTVTTEYGLTLAEIEAGKQGYFVAVSGNVTLSDDSAILTQVFKLAPYQKLRLLGVVGGNGGLPAGYKRVAWLESVLHQYINAKVNEGFDVAIWGRFQVVRPEQANNVFGGALHVLYTYNGLFRGTSIPVSSAIYEYYSDGDSAGAQLCYGRLTNTETGEVYNGTFFAAYPGQGFYSISIFKNSAGTSHGNGGSYVRFFAAKIYKSKMLVRDFIPCLDETGAPCMFDLVSRKPFYNRNVGDFIYPTESTTYALRRVLPDWGKLTEHGLRRLYHAPANYKGELIDYALENGYKPIVEPEKPEEGYWSPRWTETEDEIVLEWVETEPPMDEFGMPAETLTETE